MKTVFAVLSLFAVQVTSSSQVRYDNYKLHKVFVENEQQYEALQSLKTPEWSSLDFWNDINKIGDNLDIMVPPGIVGDFERMLKTNNIRYNTLMEDVQLVLDKQASTQKTKGLEWTDYHTLDEIDDWLFEIVAKYPKQVTPFVIGRSYEGRTIKGVKISYRQGNRAVFLESNIHAREWITSASITWVIDQLLHSQHPAVRDIAENMDWYIIPVLNVDGYVYSHEVDRLWRKSMQPHFPNCTGVDMNRNFDFLWNSAGTSNDPCSIHYAGPRAQSEPEIANLVKYIDTLPDEYIKIYISLHSYGNAVLSPWGHTDTEFPENYDDMMYVARGFADGVLRRYGTNYTCGSSATTLYKVSGAGKEWAYGAKGIPIPYTIELRDTGEHGFVLPPEQILDTATEVLDGFIGMIRAAREIKIVPARY